MCVNAYVCVCAYIYFANSVTLASVYMYCVLAQVGGARFVMVALDKEGKPTPVPAE